MKGTQRRHERVQGKLLDGWSGRPEFGDPVGCVATTYTFDAGFFEEECLARFLGLESNANESLHSYLVEREEKLSQVFAGVLVDRAHVAPDRSLRWHLLPVTVPGGGIFHAKLTLLVWERGMRILIGSANLTEPGYRKNREQQAILELGPEIDDIPRALALDIIDFLEEVRALAPGVGAPEGPNRDLGQFLQRARALANTFPAGGFPKGGASAAFVPVGPERDDLFLQLGAQWKGKVPRYAEVLSPFYNDGDTARLVASRLEGLLADKGQRETWFTGPGRKLPDGSVELDLPEALRKASAPSATHHFAYVPEQDEAGEARALHAKTLWIDNGSNGLYVVGSSNFTAAATGVGKARNIEANLAYLLPSLADRFAKLCMASAPRAVEVDLETDKVHFRAERPEETPDAQALAPLPGGFGLALYELRGERGVLRLEIGSAAPPGFRVLADLGDAGDPGEELITDEAQWKTAGAPAELERPWPATKPPTHLLVSWENEEGPQQALWVVNVSDTASLPPPEELRALSLDELLEVLTSARPAHEVVARILKRRAAKAQGGDGHSVAVDPHKKVSTRNFLLRRMRRVARALEGLRERLERPVYSEDALRWRLRGPLGPVVLAKRLAEAEGDGAAFLIAEVAMTVRGAELRPGPAISRERVEAEIAAVLEALESLARAHPAPDNLHDYVSETFAEIRA